MPNKYKQLFREFMRQGVEAIKGNITKNNSTAKGSKYVKKSSLETSDKNINIFGFKVDKVFVEGSYPILFTCTDEENGLFLCSCCQNNAEARKWLVTKTDKNIIVSMLENKITMREAFFEYRNDKYTIIEDNEGVYVSYGCGEQEYWGEDSLYLPDKGEYIEAENGEFQEEVEYYAGMN